MRIPLAAWILICLLAVSPRALAAPDPSALAFCRVLQNDREELPRVDRWTRFQDILKLTLAPGRRVGLQEERIETPPGLLLSPRPPQRGFRNSWRHLIFSISPPASVLRAADLQSLRSQHWAETHELRALSSTALRLIFAQDAEECAEQVIRLGFDHSRFMQLLNGRTRFRLLDQMNESIQASRSIRKALRRSRLPWEVMSVTDLNELSLRLRDESVRDVILIGHGLSEGKLLDSRHNTYPLRFFERFSAHLRSISIFSCHSKAVGEYYQIAENLKKSASSRHERAVYLSPGSRLAGGEEKVPLRAFPSFLRRLESRLAALERAGPVTPSRTPDSSEEDACRISMRDLRVLQGTFGILINGHFAGSIHEAESDPSFSWPCHWLRQGVNVIELRSLGAHERARAAHLEFQIALQLPGSIETPKIQHYFLRDGAYQGSKAEFNRISH